VAYLLSGEEDIGGRDWSEGKVDLEEQDLLRGPEREAYFSELPPDLGGARSLSSFKKEFEDYLYYNSSISISYHPTLKLYANLDESEEAFERRCRLAVEKARDAELEKLRDKYEAKIDRIEDKIEREERELEEDKTDYSARKQEELLSGVESVIGLFGGRRSSRRLSTASRKRRMTRQAKADIKESEDAIEDLEADLAELKEEARQDVEEVKEKWAEELGRIEQEEVRPRRADVQVDIFALAWLPRWEVEFAGQTLALPAVEIAST
jgi:hypothetical protein